MDEIQKLAANRIIGIESGDFENRMREVEVRTLQLLQLTENQRQELVSLRKEIDLLKGVEQR